MSLQLQDLVEFRGERLFNGAVNIDWFKTDEKKCLEAANSFVFHGPQYHGVSQDDVGSSHGHRLVDTASFARSVIKRCYGTEDQPFTLAIAGYGTGKSHLSITLSTLLTEPTSDIAENVLLNIESADTEIGSEIRALLKEYNQPCLVVVINGMKSFDLTAEVMHQVSDQIRFQGLDTGPIDDLRPRFRQAASLIQMSSESVVDELLDKCAVSNIEIIIDSLEKQDEDVYSSIHEFFAFRGMPIKALGGESVRDVIKVVSREYCGPGKHFARMVILFDEFGRFTEFATVRSQIAGSGVLQDLFEGIQSHADTACFVGFIQFELNAYTQRVAPEYKNEMLRYVTRYQLANKSYLSTNLETLFANLIEKLDSDKLDKWYNSKSAQQESQEIASDLHEWFPQTRNYRLWNDADQFHNVIRKGCWPLSPYSTWLLFYLTAAGKHLQERSALALLEDVFQKTKKSSITDDGSWSISPVDLWSDELQQELIGSEEIGQQGSITHAFSSVYARHGTRLAEHHISILRGIVLASKIGLNASSRDDALEAYSKIVGLPNPTVKAGIKELQFEYNVIEWDESFKAFDILGDAVPRPQFLSFLRQNVSNSFDEEAKAQLFASKATNWCELLRDLECDFAEKNSITTREWRYEGVTSNFHLLETQIKFCADRWSNAIAVDEPRGNIIYCYVEQGHEPESTMRHVKNVLHKIARNLGLDQIPILIVLLFDEEGILGQALAELSFLEEFISEDDRAKFGNLIGAHIEKSQKIVQDQVESMIMQRRYIAALNSEIEARRLARVGSEIFQEIYKKPLQFPFDGFSTARGNAANTCQQLIAELLRGSLDYDAVIAKPAKDKNRAVRVLNDTWNIFTKNGAISMRPANLIISSITKKWDKILKSDQQRFVIADQLREIMNPPHGANIASAGLVLGTFIAPRAEKLVIAKDGQQYALSQWIQDGVFRSKFLDFNSLKRVDLLYIGEVSSEWEILLDEWEQSESYYDRNEFLKQAFELKERIPVPPALIYRFAHLEEQGRNASEELRKNENSINEALNKMVKGYEKENLNLLSWGAVDLEELKIEMTMEEHLWTKHQTEELDPHIERARQAIIQIFPDWLSRQSPRTDSPDAVGNFKHVMINLVGKNLKKLGLEKQYEELELRTHQLIRDAERAAETRQLIRDVKSWLKQNETAFRILRVNELRGLKQTGKEYSNKLRSMSQKIGIADLSDVRTELAEFVKKLKEAETGVTNRFMKLWECNLSSEKELVSIEDEVVSLITAFEGCQKDLDELILMRRLLQTYRSIYDKMYDQILTWQEFHEIAENFEIELKSQYEEDEIPWPADETITHFKNEISKKREQDSALWAKQIEAETKSTSKMSAVEANRLLSKVNNPPSILTDQHVESLKKIKEQVLAHLNSLELEWLIEKFSKLPIPSKKKFLKIAAELLSNS